MLRQGRRYRLARTEEGGGIWRKRPWGWRLVSRYPLTDEGWRLAEAQFALWEPTSTHTDAGHPAGGRHRGVWPPHGRLWAVVVLAVLLVAASGVYFSGLLSRSSRPSFLRPLRTSSQAATSAGPTPSTLPPAGSGYLAAGSSYVIFIQWNDNGGSVNGSAQVLTMKGQPPNESTSSDTIPVSGTLYGSTISISINSNPLQFGTITGGSFVLDFPQSDGTLAPVTFTAASAAAYNRAVNALESDVAQENQIAANQRAARRQAQAVAQALQHSENQINSAVTTVQSDIRGLSQEETDVTQSVSSVPASLATEASDLATTKTAAQKVEAEAQQHPNGNSGQVCGDASVVAGDASVVTGAIQSLQGAMGGLQQDFAAMQSAEANLPSYIPSNNPTQSQVNAAIATANGSINSAVSTTNGYIGQANNEVTAAYGYAANAYQAGNCGTAPSPPQPQATIGASSS